ncbi:hypothetical protein EB796_014796 [Bugula neritina]|uniref:Uncharacterized protein n=1 Tax=Bugula neritina TaxID=10212 RepID=A0A7J7JKM3_BUGNE|nr:hypothetical protein EB796_014796 [Bugula neritina]
MTTDYGTGMTGKENLSGYFDVNNEGVSIKEGKPIKSWRFWSKKKKILVIGGAIFVVLLLLIIIIAATARHKKESGEIPSLSSGQACTGDTTKQNQCRSGKCLENLFICDGFKDCEGGEDEIKALCDEFSRKPRCRVEQFQCKVSRQCINTEQVCDGELDCENEEFADFSDERNCFEINPDNSVVSVIQNGVSMPMSADIGDLESYIICKEMGFRDDCSNGILTLVCEKDYTYSYIQDCKYRYILVYTRL